jgi:hypothetical protein
VGRTARRQTATSGAPAPGRGWRRWRIAAPLALLAAAGCLTVPEPPGPSGGVVDAGGDDRGDGGVDGGDCFLVFDKDFRREAPVPSEWQLFAAEARSTAQAQPDGVQLGATGLTTGDAAYAELSSVIALPLAGAELVVAVDAARVTGSSARLEIAWASTGGVRVALEVVDGAIRGLIDTGLVVTPLCVGDGCPAFDAGSWTFALRHRDGQLAVGAARDGDPVSYFATTTASLDGSFHARIAAFAEVDAELAEAVVTRVRWRSCADGS